ncbi:UPF0462 protein C4orf33 homolog [Dendronephthya gigantea]|uniref:UPF0462 protein C4orf33 homolog n=1 Tax=Dendronephthya gigantea TaxID=151771 RepID=UPI00106C6909|nr:UPF0462 protein C4orf33 homolog [Dendronephthya gigantea]
MCEYLIENTWHGDAIKSHDPVKLTLSASADNKYIVVKVDAPFFNDPGIPNAPAGEPCPQLWDYEVVEIFFLGEDTKYLEVELCPHGQHLVLMLKGIKNIIKDELELQYTVEKSEKRWTGEAKIPVEYLPPNVTLLNAYAIHGSGESRQYEALYPANKEFDQPNFHRLQFFKPFEVNSLFPNLVANYVQSPHWA